jgi:Spx/MgsR family transcriptional regulator
MADLAFYGLKTCDTCRKALKALDAKGADVAFHDVRAEGVPRRLVEKWAKAAGWENLLNKSSTTWRELPEKDKANVDEKKAIALMAAHPTLIKRPVIEKGATQIYVGWSDATQKAVL